MEQTCVYQKGEDLLKVEDLSIEYTSSKKIVHATKSCIVCSAAW